ncbi:hypothetical protein [Saccharibacillus alkalitolerans]|uniref:DUF3829 domain-containing protein n=1 Tax=Saccharibacillus alkalitolerans TaxID=2705290 RepID=A0ABX0F246_9BACL|nr:hypothetical protein [Saccharibacillus alkalitolerans]NGZ74109.1 hypothetical protein [Saccharibacillus alkalitolerans]
MNRSNRKAITRLSTAALAAVIGVSGFGYAPSVRAAEPAASSAAAAPVDLTDPIRSELIYLNDMKDNVLDLTGSYNYDYNPNAYKYYDLIAVQKKAYTMTMDPAAGSAELSALKQEYERKLHAYIDHFIKDRDVERSFSTLAYVLYHHDRIGRDESKLTPSERAELHAVWDAQEYAGQLGSQVEGRYVRAYKESYLPNSAKATDLATYEPSRYQQLASEYRADIQTRLNALSGSADRYTASVNAFEQAASLLEQMAPGGYTLNQVKMAEGNLEVKYGKLVDELTLDSPIENSAEYRRLQASIDLGWKRMDLPKGIGPGQYPQSAFGDLRRAIRKAERVLETAATLDELRAAEIEFSTAVGYFLDRRKPYAQ